MTDKNDKKPLVGVAGVKSVNAALDLLRERSRKSDKRKRKEDAEDSTDNKVASHCTSYQRFSPNKENTNAALGFSENHALSEMRLCLLRHDWAGLRQLFPLILGCYSELEPVIWRYIFIILLCTRERDASHFRAFLEMCVGAQALENSDLLERLLTVQHRDS